MGHSSNKAALSPSEALRQVGLMGKHAFAKLSMQSFTPPDSHTVSSSLTGHEHLDSAFKQHPDLFREPSQAPSNWAEEQMSLSAGAVHTLLIREQQSTSLLREYILSDHRLHMCATAERLSDACKKIRQQNYQVIVLSISSHMQDMVALLDLMNTSNPRAKAVAVLDEDAIAQLQNMIHPKVLGYVAAQDAAKHLTDAVMEVSHGRFTASPSISDVVMRLTSSYLAERAPPIGHTTVTRRNSEVDSESDNIGHSNFASSGFASSQMHSSFLPSTPHSMASEISGFSSRRKVSTAMLSQRETGILVLISGGLSSAEISEQLAISVPTVNTHIRNMFSKLGVHTRAQAIHVGISQGMIEVQ